MLHAIFAGMVCGNAYRAAVVEHRPSSASTGFQQNSESVRVYADLAEKAAKQGAQIIVFPEYGITGEDGSSSAAGWINMGYAERIPPVADVGSERVIPCDNPSSFGGAPSLISLSCSSKASGIAIVANLMDYEDWEIYNTNVVLDTDGTYLAKYRKMNLWGESNVEVPADCEEVTFRTSFNVTFGVITCADIIYEFPALSLVEKGIRDFVWPAAWTAEMAHLQVMAFGQGWSLRHGVNLLLSNLQQSDIGSAIWTAGRTLVYDNKVDENASRLFIANVPEIADIRISFPIGHASVPVRHRFKLSGMSPTSSWAFAPLSDRRVCSKRICCEADFANASAIGFALAALDGSDSDEGYISWPVQICAVLPCKSALPECLTHSLPGPGIRLQHVSLKMSGLTATSVVPEILSASVDEGLELESLVRDARFSLAKGIARLDVTVPAPATISSAVIYGRTLQDDTLPYACPKVNDMLSILTI